ncbi:MAG: lipoyl synthase [Thermoanaerobacteraceae bacterium]|nr:lipoyl synthase [Thermoanaerobacteraceae bacterium]
MDKERIFATEKNCMERPRWLKVPVPDKEALAFMEELLRGAGLYTVCEGALCPNMGECFGKGTATFMILGETCTRNCRFCSVKKGKPELPKAGEPQKLAEAVLHLGLKHVVITSVTRDDLEDGGAGHFADSVSAVHTLSPETTVEVLVPDFQGSAAALKVVIESRPEIIGHNVETVPRLYSQVRPRADYRRSLEVLAQVKKIDPSIKTKSGIMLGLGETEVEVIDVLKDLRNVGCDIVTLGQYLQPTREQLPVYEYITPEAFREFGRIAREMGFSHVVSLPLARSSYHAEEAVGKCLSR